MQWELQYFGKVPINDTEIWNPLELLTWHDLLVKQKKKEVEAQEAAARKAKR